MIVEHESDDYEFWYDALYGVGRFIRKSDGAVTLLLTDSECADMRRDLNELSQKETGDKFNMLFNSIAMEYNYYD